MEHRISAKDRQHLIQWNRGAVPASHGIERDIQAVSDGHALQRADVLVALLRAFVAVFILNLNTDYGPPSFHSCP